MKSQRGYWQSIITTAKTHRVLILVDGEQRSNFTVEPGEEIWKQEYFGEGGEHNVTIRAAGSNVTVKAFVTREGEQYVASDVRIDLEEDGGIYVTWGGTDDRFSNASLRSFVI